MQIKRGWHAKTGESLPPALEGVDKPTFAHSSNQERLKTSLSRCGQTGLPTPRATPIFNREEFKQNQIPSTQRSRRNTPTSELQLSFGIKLFKDIEPPLTPESRERITQEVDERFRLRILRTDWWEGGPINWAVDRESDSYLSLAIWPFTPPSEGTCYAFFFQSKMYHFTMPFPNEPIVTWRFGKPSDDEIAHLRSALTQAFAVHGFSGHVIGYESPIAPIFAEELQTEEL